MHLHHSCQTHHWLTLQNPRDTDCVHTSHHSCTQVPSTQLPVASVSASLSANAHTHWLPKGTSPWGKESLGSRDPAFFAGCVDLYTEFHPVLPGHRSFIKWGRGGVPLEGNFLDLMWGHLHMTPFPEWTGDQRLHLIVLSWFSFCWSKRKLSSCHGPLPPAHTLSIFLSWILCQ